MMVRYLFLIALLLCTAACLRQPLEPLSFFSVLTKPLSGQLEKVVLRGQLDGLSGQTPDAIGFIYNMDIEAIQAATPVGQILAAKLMAAGEFEGVFTDLRPEQTVHFRAFARVGDRTIYGAVRSYRLGEVVRVGVTEVFNDSASIAGTLAGVRVSADTVLEHGHVYSTTNPLPELGRSDCTATNLGSKDADYDFKSPARNLNLNTTYYVRAYAKGRNKTFYSPAATFRVRDGWKRIPDLFPFQQAVTAVGGGRAYVGFGCDANTACNANSLPDDWWSFSPEGAGLWRKATAFDPLFARTNASSFTIGDTIYVLMGEYFEFNERIFVADLVKFDLKTQTWHEGDLPARIAKRSGATAFVLNGRGYVGAGEGSDGVRTVSKNDFWEYTPQTSAWRPVARLPLQENPAQKINYTAGRAEPVGFVVGANAYVGCGRAGNFALKDFWRFTPPTSTLDTGRWVLETFLPDVARYDATGFAIGDKGYCGLGYNLAEGPLADWWSYRPADKTWRRCTPFTGGRRYDAIGFALGSFGYAGTGLQIVPTPNGISLQSRVRADMWRYEPE
jgi:N-acetylneuraminic acid mutarotase